MLCTAAARARAEAPRLVFRWRAGRRCTRPRVAHAQWGRGRTCARPPPPPGHAGRAGPRAQARAGRWCEAARARARRALRRPRGPSGARRRGQVRVPVARRAAAGPPRRHSQAGGIWASRGGLVAAGRGRALGTLCAHRRTAPPPVGTDPSSGPRRAPRSGLGAGAGGATGPRRCLVWLRFGGHGSSRLGFAAAPLTRQSRGASLHPDPRDRPSPHSGVRVTCLPGVPPCSEQLSEDAGVWN